MPAPSLHVYHIAERLALSPDHAAYTPAGFEREGFVHCSRWSQLVGVARALFAGRGDLVVLEIDTSRLDAEVRYEDCCDAGQAFPHVYGPINRSAIVGTLDVAWPVPGEPCFTRPGVELSPEALVVRRAHERDVDVIARMNHALREDEGYPDDIPVSRLKERLHAWLADGYESWVLEAPPVPAAAEEATGPSAGRVPVGYAHVDPTREPIYLRQLYVSRGARRFGLGREAVNELLEHYEAATADVDALVGNDAARRFWRELGFDERSVGMRRSAEPGGVPAGDRAAAAEEKGAAKAGGAASRRAPADDTSMSVISGHTGDAARWILDRLKAYNDAHSPHHRALREAGGSEPVAVMLHDARGRWVGGVCGDVHWGWLHVDDLLVADEYRGAGHGRALLLELERQAARRGATRSQLSTFHFQARGMYEKLGYRVVGEMIDLPPGGSMYWMRKDGLG